MTGVPFDIAWLIDAAQRLPQRGNRGDDRK
jgi:hypothetical protein